MNQRVAAALLGLLVLSLPAWAQEESAEKAPDESEPVAAEPSGIPSPTPTPALLGQLEDESVVLNFEGADIREVIHSLGDALGINYSIDPSVSGQVTIRTTGKIPRKDLFAVFNQILRSYGLAAMKVGDVYYINQVALAKTKAEIPHTLPEAKEAAQLDEFVIEIVKVEHIAAQEMLNVIQPFVTPGGDVFPYPRANLLIISDLKSNVERLRDLVKTFDRDTFRDLHAKIYKIEHVGIQELGDELLSILDTYGVTPSAAEERGVYVIPLERLTSIAIIAFNPTVFPEVEHWLKVLDVPPEEGAGRTVRVYPVENAKAADLSAILNELYGGESSSRSRTQRRAYTPFGTQRRDTGRRAPAAPRRGTPARAGGRQGMFDDEFSAYDEYLEPSAQFRGRGTTGSQFGRGQGGGTGRGGTGRGGGFGRGAGTSTGFGRGRRGSAGPSGVVIPGGEPGGIFRSEVRIVADDISNSLVILATRKDYDQIVEVLKKLDVVPRQALIEVLVAEVTLDDEFKFGVTYTLAKRNLAGLLGVAPASSSGDGGGGGSSNDSSLLGSQRAGGLRLPDVNAAATGLFGIISDNRQFLFELNALAGEGKLRVLSSPHILTADNREAHILVGEEVPILTTQTTSSDITLLGTSGILQNIQYRDTGVVLTVMPQVNSQGLVNLEITQEVSNIKSTSTGGIQSPTFSTRESQTTVVVQSGETVVIGGIIQEQVDHTRSGIPYLMDIPAIGRVFRFESDKSQRVELIVLLTPHVVRNRQEAREATGEFIGRLRGLGAELRKRERRLEQLRRRKRETGGWSAD